MDSFEQMYVNLTSLIRKDASSEEVSSEYSKILQAYPGSEVRLLSMLDSAFGNHGGFKTQRNMFEQGATHIMVEIGSPNTGDIYPYSENKEMHYSQKGKKKR